MKKRKSYAEVEPVKKKEKLCLERFCHYYNKKETKTTKRKAAKTYIPVSHLLKKKVKEGPDYICSVWCLVSYQINWEKLFFPCVSQSTRCLLLLAQT